MRGSGLSRGERYEASLSGKAELCAAEVREQDERLHAERYREAPDESLDDIGGWPFCGDGEDVSERGHPQDGELGSGNREDQYG